MSIDIYKSFDAALLLKGPEQLRNTFCSYICNIHCTHCTVCNGYNVSEYKTLQIQRLHTTHNKTGSNFFFLFKQRFTVNNLIEQFRIDYSGMKLEKCMLDNG